MRTDETYRRLLHSLFPPGKAWTRVRTSNFSKLLKALAQEFKRVDDAMLVINTEAYPDEATVAQLLTDYEIMLGLPDECTPVLPATEAERQQLVKARMTARGGQSEAYFIELGKNLGYDDVIITGGGEPITCESECDDPLIPENEIFVWLVELQGDGDFDTTVCLIRDYAPAHTFPVITEIQ